MKIGPTWAFTRRTVQSCGWRVRLWQRTSSCLFPAVCVCFCACVRWQRRHQQHLHPGGPLQQHHETQGVQHEVDLRWGGSSLSKVAGDALQPAGRLLIHPRRNHTVHAIARGWGLCMPGFYDVNQRVDGSELAETGWTPFYWREDQDQVLVHANLFSPCQASQSWHTWGAETTKLAEESGEGKMGDSCRTLGVHNCLKSVMSWSIFPISGDFSSGQFV